MLVDRADGGRQLAEKLQQYKDKSEDAVVIGLPRGGVVTGYYVASELGLPLDLVVVRKIGAPHNDEYAVGALSEDGSLELDEHLMKIMGIKENDLKETIAQEQKEAERRVKTYRGNRPPPEFKNKTVLLVDDGK
jgi:putative phosphoribosyl transferase